MINAYCYMRSCDALASSVCRICSLPVCDEHRQEYIIGPVCTRCLLRIEEMKETGVAISPTPPMSRETTIMYDPSTSAREILRDLARILNTYGKRSIENACLVADSLLMADEANDPVLRKDRTVFEKDQIRRLCKAITMLGEPGYIFTENPDLPHYFGFIKEDPNGR